MFKQIASSLGGGLLAPTTSPAGTAPASQESGAFFCDGSASVHCEPGNGCGDAKRCSRTVDWIEIEAQEAWERFAALRDKWRSTLR